MTITTDLAKQLAIVLDLDAKAAPSPSPYHFTVDELAHGKGIMRTSDHHPVRNVAEHSEAGYAMEVARNEGLRAGKADRSAQRMARARAMARRKAEFDAIEASDAKPSRKRMDKAWRVVFPLVPIVTRIANGKERWAARFLGSVVNDVSQIVLERMAVTLAKSDKDLHLLMRAADELGAQAERSHIPGDQLSEDERAERKQLAKARKWLMGMVNNRVQGTLVDLYTSQENLRWTNLDIIATVLANINGIGEDPMTSRFKADRAPAFLATRFQRPDGIDHALLSVAINAAITDRGLDLMTEILLNEESRRSDGAFKWSANAERIFLATPGDGEWLWSLVCKATEKHARPKRARADAARMHARNQFGWLPGFIVATVDSFDQHAIGWSMQGPGGKPRAVMASDFELGYLPDPPERRLPLVPALRYATVEEAVAALAEHIHPTDPTEYIEA